ncbi:MAG: OmpH family outer membrane protein [Bacteroidales bacterium]|jgi:outer membrane protein|nr:OmpH family outer membrane protein [Bacteroidales bacterium]
MKKITLVVAFVVCISTAFAQKYGHVNSTEIMKAMPGIDSVEIKLMDFHKNMQIIYENMMSEFQTKKEKLDKEAGTMTSSIRKLREDELTALQNRIQEFSMNAQDDVEEQQQILLAPFQERVQNAINDVAKENKYSYIFDVQILLYYDGGDDVTSLVKKKLGIK